MIPAFLRSLGVGEDPVGEAKVHLRKAKLIFDLGKNTLALARLPKDYEVSRNILETAKGHLDEAARAIAEALKGETPVDEVLPLFHLLSRDIPAKMKELGGSSSGLADSEGGPEEDPLEAFQKEVDLALWLSSEGQGRRALKILRSLTRQKGPFKDALMKETVLDLTRQTVEQKSLKEDAGKAVLVKDYIDQALTSLSQGLNRAEAIQNAYGFLSRAEATARTILGPARRFVERAIQVANQLWRDSVRSYSLEEKREEKEKEPAREVFESIRSYLKLKSGDPIPPDLYSGLKIKLESNLKSLKESSGVVFKTGDPDLPFPNAEEILAHTEQLISRSGDVLKKAARQDLMSLDYLKSDYKAADLLLRAQKLVHQASAFVSTMGRPEEPTTEEIEKKFPRAPASTIVTEKIRESIRRRKKAKDLVSRIGAASREILKLSNQSNFLRKMVLGLPEMLPPGRGSGV